jgi:hypothetical protein
MYLMPGRRAMTNLATVSFDADRGWTARRGAGRSWAAAQAGSDEMSVTASAVAAR